MAVAAWRGARGAFVVQVRDDVEDRVCAAGLLNQSRGRERSERRGEDFMEAIKFLFSVCRPFSPGSLYALALSTDWASPTWHHFDLEGLCFFREPESSLHKWTTAGADPKDPHTTKRWVTWPRRPSSLLARHESSQGSWHKIQEVRGQRLYFNPPQKSS